MEFVLFLAGVSFIGLLIVGKILTSIMDDITRRMYLKRMDDRTMQAMLPKDIPTASKNPGRTWDLL